ncbi:MAG: hypothetical protein M1608_04585 [Candidatus Omnitrophica bacterium]|nr:hypothetical protein [Candidatus Omnitrophota bacterium]
MKNSGACQCVCRKRQIKNAWFYSWFTGWLFIIGPFPQAASAAVALDAVPYEPATLSISPSDSGGWNLSSNPLRFTGYKVQASADLAAWQDTGVAFGPAKNTHLFASAGESNRFFRLGSDGSPTLQCLTADATTIQLNWPPIPSAVEYKVYRNGAYVGSTAARTGYYLDNGLKPVQSYKYYILALDSSGKVIGHSPTNTFSTLSSSSIRTHYKVLAVAFYPEKPDPAELSHIKTYLRHRIDFLRLASLNTAVMDLYRDDVICIRTNPPISAPDSFNIDYVKLAVTPYAELGGYSMVDLVEKGDVDTVWVTRAPKGFNFFENALVGNKDINPNPDGEHWDPAPAKCSRSFFINSYEPDARCYDAYAHMVEGIMTTMGDGYPANWPRNLPYVVLSKTRTDFTTTYNAQLRLFERFRLTDEWTGTGAYASRGNANCGSSHFPPTSRRDVDKDYDGDYAYYDLKSWQRYVDCAADDWLNYPNLTGAKRKVNGYDYGGYNYYKENEPSYATAFGASPELHPSFRFGSDSYHLWWFYHLPHNAGVSNGKLNTWWPYLFDFNRFNGDQINYPVNGFPEMPVHFPPVNSEYGTEVGTSELWGYWHSFGDFGPWGQVTVVNSAENPEAVKNGSHAIKVDIREDLYQSNGRNDTFYPITRNAGWNLADLREVSIAIKPGLNPSLITGANPVIRLCQNGGNRIELAPLKNGRYANLFLDNSFKGQNGWFVFNIPITGNANWEASVIGYIDPKLSQAEVAAAKQQLKQSILSKVNYVQISILSDGTQGDRLSYYIDGLEFHTGP